MKLVSSSLFSPSRIRAAMRHPSFGLTIEAVASTGSTNADLMARIGHMTMPIALVADHQTAGRGRAGRCWHSSADASLTFSLAWRFGLSVQALSGLSLVVGVALADALAQTGAAVQLKWPNDLLIDQKKLGGVLIETSADPRDASSLWAVIGVGINLQSSVQAASDIGQPIASLALPIDADRNVLLALILDHLCANLVQFEQCGFAQFVPRWDRLHAHRDFAVSIIDRGVVLHTGIARGVDAQGCLLLDTSTGMRAIAAGDVSLRAMEN